MSGHSKWHSIKHKKGAADAKRGQQFTKLSNAIAIAARGGADPEVNFSLRLAIDKAKAANMPNSNIEKAVLRGSGQLEGEQIQEVTYEGYGPGGVAIIVEGATDNKNRTYSDIRTAFSKNGGNMAETGAVAFQFEQKGVIVIEVDDTEAATLVAIEAGAEDVEEDSGVLTVYTAPKELNAVRTNLQDAGLKLTSAELGYEPTQIVPVEDAQTAKKVLNLMEVLDGLDDVTNTYSNFDISEAVLEKVT